MKILITEQQFKRLVENIINEETREEAIEWLNKKWKIQDWFSPLLNKLTIKTSDKYPNSVFYEYNNEVYMEHKNDALWVNYDKIWSILSSKYSLNYQEIRDFIKDGVDEHLNIRGVTPIKKYGVYNHRWKNI